jgi:hypothetical protein
MGCDTSARKSKGSNTWKLRDGPASGRAKTSRSQNHEERFDRQPGQREKCAVRQQHPLADQRVDVRMPRYWLSEGLDGADHAGHSVGTAAGRAMDGDHRGCRGPAQLSEQPALEPEVDAQPLGNREHEFSPQKATKRTKKNGIGSAFLKGPFGHFGEQGSSHSLVAQACRKRDIEVKTMGADRCR